MRQAPKKTLKSSRGKTQAAGLPGDYPLKIRALSLTAFTWVLVAFLNEAMLQLVPTDAGRVFSIEECMGCSRCVAVCPSKALAMKDVRHLFKKS